MAEFEVNVVRIDRIEDHPNADALELAIIGGYRAIVKIGEFRAGDLVVYIPEASILPQWLLKEMGLEGYLAGKDKNRVKAIKLRGILSQGLVLPIKIHMDKDIDIVASNGKIWTYHIIQCEHQGYIIGEGYITEDVESQFLGLDVAELLGIVQWEPPIPISMVGEVCNIYGKTLRYDIENLKKYPHILEEGEEVVMTEKLHGTFMGIGYWPGLGKTDLFEGGDVFTFSKGLGAQGLVFKDNENNWNNLYVKNLVDLIDGVGFNIINGIKKWFEYGKRAERNPIKEFRKGKPMPVYILAEIFCKGIQDLAYGLDADTLCVFDVFIGEPSSGRYLDYDEMVYFCEEIIDVAMVPVLYHGPYSKELADGYCEGLTEVQGGKGACIREGVVIKPAFEARHDEIGRVILKHVSERYLLRKNATEYN